jgi:hypothetical protein
MLVSLIVDPEWNVPLSSGHPVEGDVAVMDVNVVAIVFSEAVEKEEQRDSGRK